MGTIPVLLPPFLGLAALLAAMAVLWLVQRRTGNAAIVDVGWTLGVGALGIGFALAYDGAPLRRALLGGMAGLWSLRLGAHLLRDRVLGRPEEGRYRRLREHWGVRQQPYLLLFFLAQAVAAALLALAFVPGARDGRPAPDALDAAGVALFVIAWLGEAVADRQLAHFKAQPGSQARVCDRGLWGWSRHPNYFFEWLAWVAFVLPGLHGPGGLLALLAPAAMLLLILRVTGIPTSEAQALRSRGEAYRDYQRRVSRFFPRPPRRDAPA